ncbi:N-acylglucosamine 2-epimerase isoform X7 [Patagioenas fasciata]|uniref:N-acylglucosamine 2-epimerase isoform X7 n=1 Tax=Patagioenas fasciata TaxID=372321 RepID=UPI003A99E156
MVSLSEWRERVAAALDETLGFWERHSHDPEHGGFFSCLSRDGSVYDDTKYVWMQGRQIWVYSRLYRTFPRFRRPELLEAARAAGEFLLRCARLRPGSPRVAFALSRAGTPLRLQRAPYSELFCAMGLDELGRATGEARYRAEARQWVLAVWGWVRGAPQEWGPPRVPGCPPRQSFGVPMMLLALGLQLLEGGGGDPQIEAVAEWGAQRLLLHLQRGDQVVLENVSPEGQELGGSEGRLMNPGHALEGGWLLLQFCARRGAGAPGAPGALGALGALGARAVAALVERPLQWGWDPQHGGLFAFLDADGLCPTQLEWPMKLWWPHAEAMGPILPHFPPFLPHFRPISSWNGP